MPAASELKLAPFSFLNSFPLFPDNHANSESEPAVDFAKLRAQSFADTAVIKPSLYNLSFICSLSPVPYLSSGAPQEGAVVSRFDRRCTGKTCNDYNVRPFAPFPLQKLLRCCSGLLPLTGLPGSRSHILPLNPPHLSV